MRIGLRSNFGRKFNGKFNRKFGRRSMALAVCALMLLSIAGCGKEQGNRAGTGDYGEDVNSTESVNAEGNTERKEPVNHGDNKDISASAGSGDNEAGNLALTEFGVRLLQENLKEKDVFPEYASMPQGVYEELMKGENILISPLSVITALSMTANGAKGETLEQMEETFGLSALDLEAYLADYRRNLSSGSENQLSMANSIWFTEDDRFQVDADYLKRNKETLGAEWRRAPFDISTVNEINAWVKEHTRGMIENILDEIPENGIMYLVNALAFEGQWQEIYYEYQVQQGEFTGEGGNIQAAELMYSTEEKYLEDEFAEGFLKYYADQKYVFAALLPKEGISVREYVDSLTGQHLYEMLRNPIETKVYAAIPKFQAEYGVCLNDILREMGMDDAFNEEKADFTGIGFSQTGNIYISKIAHKTFIAVDEKGTKAGAVTAVEMADNCAVVEIEEPKLIYLDRPFLYMIVDCETNVPVFIGTMMNLDTDVKQ